MSTFDVISMDGSYLGDSLDDVSRGKKQIEHALHGKGNVYM